MSTPRPAKLRLARSLADVSPGGDAFSVLAISLFCAVVAGAAVGAFLGHVGYGLALGLLLGALGWAAGVAWAHAHLVRQSPLRHKRLE